ncbi:basic 7S globulin 2-like [Cynara cardunculus var. scolymus]|uniref:Aspartic peptidase n=1 Tax=Cynara cardunculus var. scolymus TaxID=59895 RepID=A0A103XPE0_CYNCS|nr:basic 7S globulin 2-like [Cynara cardunculus var. scolymus]KVH94400.1 Aspartic peptidase [Cynara cardunculus var. scolymus]
MASSNVQLLVFSVFLFLSLSFAQPSFRPDALVVPVRKDAATGQYVTQINQKTPLVPENLVVDLGGKFLWVDCDNNYISSTYRPARCRSALCSLAGADGCGDCFGSARPGCNNDTCGVSPYNPIIRTATSGELATDLVQIRSTDGSNPGRPVNISRFLFSCAPTFLLQGLANGVSGMAGLGRTRIALPTQLAAAFSFDRKFAICLSSSTTSDGVVFFGDGPYNFLPNIDVSQSLMRTRLIINPVSTTGASSPGEPSAEYFIGVSSIRVNSKSLSLNASLLSIDNQGNGGTKISTVNPYTILETSIYNTLTAAFISEAAIRNITRVPSVAPFDVCFSTSNVLSTRVGPAVPSIELVLENQNVVWMITGSNSMVQVNDNVLCLGIINGGSNPRTSIVIGGYQLENNLLQFDLATSNLGFSSTLLGRQTTCANFNFTSNA